MNMRRFNRWLLRKLCLQRGSHDWKLHSSKYSDDGAMIFRYVRFVCKSCYKRHYERRWAFAHGAGALTHFFGRDW